MKNITRIQKDMPIISKHITATRLRDKISQMVVSDTLKNPISANVSRVFLHADGSMTGNVKIKGKILDVRFDNSLSFWKYAV